MAGAKIVIVEDEQIVALDIKMHLQKYGYEVPAIFASGEEAVDGIPALNPDLVLMDIKLQGTMDGLEAASQITEEHSIPVILLTANADESTIQRAKFTQPYAYIIKPFEERELRTAIVLSLYRHEMEQKLIQREQLFSTTLRSIGEAVVVTDSFYRIDFMNPVAEQFIEKSLSQVYGMQLSEMLRLEDEDHQVLIHTPDMTAEPSPDFLVPMDFPAGCVLVPAEGAPIPVDVRQSALIDGKGRHTGWVWVLNDITSRLESEKALRESEQQLRHAQKMEAVGRLSGGIAHDFNNLLTIIMGYSKLLKEALGKLDDSRKEELEKDVDGILNAATKSANLTRQLLAFSRHQVMQPRVISLNRIVSEVEKMVRRLLSENITMQIMLTDESCRIHADQGQIEQVLINLAVNAKDAMPDGGRLTIRTLVEQVKEPKKVHTGIVAPGSYAVLRVIDSGTGIPSEVVNRIFDPFFTTKAVGRGTGLGLSTVYGIVTQSGGAIEVNNNMDSGATFSVYLPLSVRDEDEEEVHTVEKTRLSGNETVLIVEDEESVQALLTRVLRMNGYTVITTQNAGEALLITEEQTQKIDLLVTDVVMPHITGVKLGTRLRSLIPELRVLLISGHPEDPSVEAELQSSPWGFLQKPFAPETLLQKVRSVLDK